MRKLRSQIPSGNLLYVFDAAARRESFTRAADELNVTPAAVSHAIRQLEAGLGFPLFLRRHRQLALTAEGQKLAESISAGLTAIEDTISRLSAARAASVVRIHAPITVGTYWLLPRLTGYPDPATRIEIQLYNSDHSLDLPDDGLSFAITNGRTVWPGHDVLPFAKEVISPVCSPSYLGRHGPIAGVADLVRHRLLHLDHRYHDGATWADFLARFGVAFDPAQDGITHNSYILVIHEALTGAGIGLGWHHSMGELLKSGALVRALDLDVETGEAFHIVNRKDAPLRPDTLRVRDWLIRLARAGGS